MAPRLIRCLLLAACMLWPTAGCLSATRVIDAGRVVHRAWPLPDGRIALCTDTEYQIWDASDAPRLLHRTDLPKVDGEPDWVGAAPASGDRMAFSVRSLEPAQARVGVFDLSTRDKVEWPEKVEGQIWSMTTSPSGRLVAWSECNRETGRFRLKVADTISMSPVCDVGGRLFYRYQTIDVLRFSDDEGLLAFGGWSGELSLGVMDVKKGAVLWYVKGFGPSDLAFSPDGRRLYATNSGGSLGCFDSSSGEKVWNDVVRFPMLVPFLTTVQSYDRLGAVDVSPDGDIVAASTFYTHKVIIWDAASGKQLKSLDLSDYPIAQALFFDPSGEGIWAAGALDSKLKCYPLVVAKQDTARP